MGRDKMGDQERTRAVESALAKRGVMIAFVSDERASHAPPQPPSVDGAGPTDLSDAVPYESQIPVVATPEDHARARRLDPRAEVLLQRMDGTTTIGMLLGLGELPPATSRALLDQLIREGIVSLK